MTRGYGEQLGDALQSILNPPSPSLYFIKHVREVSEREGWERIKIVQGHREIRVSLTREYAGKRRCYSGVVSVYLLESEARARNTRVPIATTMQFCEQMRREWDRYVLSQSKT